LTLNPVNVPTLVRDEVVTPDARVLPVRVPAGAADKNARAARVPPVPTLRVEPSVPANANELLTVRVLPLATVNTPVVLVIVKPLTLVAVAAPSVGVTNTGLDARTIEPDPVVVLPSAVTVPLVGSVRLVAPVAVNVVLNAPDVARVLPFASVRMPVVLLIVRPLTLVAVAAPSVGVTRTGLVARTIEPEPVVVFPSAVRVPVVGIVTDVVPVVVTVSGNAPTVVTLPAMVIVFVPLFTPVPPEAPPSVPARVTAPVVAVDGVRPVSDVWKVATLDVPLALIVPALSDKPEPTTRPETVDPVDA